MEISAALATKTRAGIPDAQFGEGVAVGTTPDGQVLIVIATKDAEIRGAAQIPANEARQLILELTYAAIAAERLAASDYYPRRQIE